MTEKFGYIYKITCINDKLPCAGWIYVGKKQYLYKKRKKLTKKEKLIPENKRKKSKTVHVVADPKDNYMGSSKELKEAINKYGLKSFKKEIIDYRTCKADLALKEGEWQCKLNVLRTQKSWNNWIGCRIFKKNLNNADSQK